MGIHVMGCQSLFIILDECYEAVYHAARAGPARQATKV
jgi:hypothetical protein